MKKIYISALIAVGCMMTNSYAGGDIVAPEIIPMEPVNVTRVATPVYVGIGSATGRYKASCSSNCKYQDITAGVVLRAGYEFNQYIGIEARYIATFFGANDLRGQTMQHVGLFVKPTYSLSEDFNMYGLVGYGWTKSTSEGSVKLLTIDGGGFSAGLGLEYDLSSIDEDYDKNIYYPEGFDGQADQEKGWGLFVDYQRLLIKSNAPDMDVFSGGVTYDF
jgi:OOP family OmpA-OmpF porin